MLGRFVSEGQTCLDIGANFGQYAIPLARLVGEDGTVVCFEPMAISRTVLNRVVKLLGYSDRILILPYALGERDEGVMMTIPKSESGDPNLAEAHVEGRGGRGRAEVACRRLDGIEDIRSRSRIAFIKCDVEGSELAVLLGGEGLIRQHQPVILCEVEERHNRRYDRQPSQVFELLSDWGYAPFVLGDGALVETGDFDRRHNNYFFIPRNYGC